MIQTRPFEFMTSYTPQREWIEKRGIFLWLSFFFVELGAGTFFIAVIFKNLEAMAIGWLCCLALGAGFHLVYLGKPLRFYRAFLRLQSSWISRGIIFIFMFSVMGAGQLYCAASNWNSDLLSIISDLAAFLVMVYGGFAMNYINGIPLWNTALLPAIYVIASMWGGAEIVLGVSIITEVMSRTGAGEEGFIRVLLSAFLFIVIIYLVSIRYGSKLGELSVKEILFGKRWPLFLIVVVLVGAIFPMGTVINNWLFGLELTPEPLLYSSIVCGLSGDLLLRYLIFRNGFYEPLTPYS